MIKFLFCDDEPIILDTLFEKTVSSFALSGYKAEGKKLSDPFALSDMLKQETPDILFLDIDLSVLNGMDIAESILKEPVRPLIIFVTQHDALVYKSFACRPFGFIRKSFFDDEITETIHRAVMELSERNAFFSFQNSNGLVRFKYDDILYFESKANYIHIHTAGKNVPIGSDEKLTRTGSVREHSGQNSPEKGTFLRFRGTMQALEADLKNKGFIRIHKGFLVNQLHIFTVRSDEIELDNHELLPIGRVNREQIRNTILRYLR